MNRLLLTVIAIALATASASAQSPAAAPPAAANNAAANSASSIPPPPAITANSTPLELARAALAAQGGEKFKNLKNVWIYGTADLYAPNSTQSIPGKFSIVTAGAKLRMDIDASPNFKFKQIFDGQQAYSSMPGVAMPPADKFGLPVLVKYDQPGYTVSAIPNEKKLRGFRIVDAEGNQTDFYIDPTTARVMKYVSPYNGYTVGTENSKFKEIDGVLIPFNFSQRFEMPMGAFFADFKVKEAKLNQALGDDVFLIQ
ncbi:MAG TPA: hypothetical protein VGP81_14515 [Pyrinomonadaceae bacterium]|jgi:hypothetical protein|nr:hypothetical protein [Pyrinomonadaceae bacterium]